MSASVIPSLAVLKQGLANLKSQVELRKSQIQTSLKKGEKVSEEDSQWLDGEANIVDEVFVLDLLSEASDYPAKYQELWGAHLTAVQRLATFGQDVIVANESSDSESQAAQHTSLVGAKRKRMFIS